MHCGIVPQLSLRLDIKDPNRAVAVPDADEFAVATKPCPVAPVLEFGERLDDVTRIRNQELNL